MGLVMMKMNLSLPCDLAWKLVRLGGKVIPFPGLDCGRRLSAAAAASPALFFQAPQHFFLEIRLQGVLDRVDVSYMPGQRAADKETLSFYVPRTLSKRLRKMADHLGTTLTDVVVMILTKETQNIELTADDYEAIARETRAAERKNSTRTKATAARASQSRA